MESELFLKKQDITEIQRHITIEEVKKILLELSSQLEMNITDLVKQVALKKADGFSVNKNSPYTHLYIGNGSENISVELMTLEKEIKLKIPKSSILD